MGRRLPNVAGDDCDGMTFASLAELGSLVATDVPEA